MGDTKATAEILGREIANLGYPTGMGMAPHPETLARIAAAVTASHEARIAELEGALRPFAALHAESMRDFPDGTKKGERPDDKHAWGFNNANLTWGDFRRARRALHTEGE